MAFRKQFNGQSRGEEIANSVSHGVGIVLSVAGTVALLCRASGQSGVAVASAWIYGVSLILLYSFSTLYHSVNRENTKRVLRVFDHCSIYLLIVGTYAPISLVLIGRIAEKPVTGAVIFGINTLCMIVGIVLSAVDISRFRKITLALDVAMGWLVILSIRYVYAASGTSGLFLLASGGIVYTVGVIFYVLGKKRENPDAGEAGAYRHFLWHLFVLAGSILHYLFVYGYCYPTR